MNGKEPRGWGRLLGQIFWSFFKISPVTFGGGYAMIPAFHQEVVDKRRWLEEEDVGDILALAQSAPGGIGINSSICVGYRLAGVYGAIAALAGVMLPTFLILLTMCLLFVAVKDHEKVQAALKGIRPAIVALIAYAGYKVGRTAIRDKTTLLLALASVSLLLATGVNPLLVILLGIAAGILLTFLQARWLGPVVLEKLDEPDVAIEDYFMGEGI